MFTREFSDKPKSDEVRSALMEAGDHLVGLNLVEREKRDANWDRDVRSAIDFIHNWDPVLAAYEAGQRGPTGGLPAAGTAILSNPERRTAGQLFVVSNGYEDFASRHQSGATHFETELRGSLLVDNREVRTALDSTADGMWTPVGTPSAFPPVYQRQRMFVRDALSVQGTNLPSVPYIRELNTSANETGASAVSEATAKPEVVMEFEQDDAPIRKIAAWIPATTEIIDDAPTLRGYIDTRLAYMLALREEQQILNGSGSAPQLKGILQYAGLQTQAFSTDVAITLGSAIGKIENVEGDPDTIAMNPIKYWAMLTTRSSSQFDGGFGGGAPFDRPSETIWGMNVIRTRALTLNQGLVGSFRLGATLFDRQQTTIRVGAQHSDYFTTNRVAILAEERVGLAVHRPDFFVLATLA